MSASRPFRWRAQETRNPERDVSITILAALAICTLLYVLMSVVLMGIIDWHLLDVPDPVSFALARDPGAAAGWSFPSTSPPSPA